MTYFGLPPFYPPGWFWIGGRIAALTGTPAWEMFKPWAIISITVAVVVAFVLWASMIRFEYALIVSTATAAATLAYSPAEPYAAIITVLLPPVSCWPGPGCGVDRGGGWAAVIGVGIFLGFAALFYTLLLAYSAFTLTIMAVLLALSRAAIGPAAAAGGHRGDRRRDRADRLAAIPVGRDRRIAGRLRHRAALPAVRRRTAVLPDAAVHAARCAVHGRHAVAGGPRPHSTRAGALAIAVLAVYAWSLLSMLTTLAGTTLLSFRLQPTLTVLLTAAGAFGFIEATLAIAAAIPPGSGRRIVAAAARSARSVR